MTQLIGITGRAGAGKDTLAHMLAAQGLCKTEAFGDRLKQILAVVSGEPIQNFYDRESKEQLSPALGMTRRQAMQQVGTEAFRALFGEDVWALALLRAWEASGRPRMIVTDVRFDNEARAIIAAGGLIVKVERPQHEHLQGEAAKHVSEEGIDQTLVTHVVVNDQDLWALRGVANALADHLWGGGHGR